MTGNSTLNILLGIDHNRSGKLAESWGLIHTINNVINSWLLCIIIIILQYGKCEKMTLSPVICFSFIRTMYNTSQDWFLSAWNRYKMLSLFLFVIVLVVVEICLTFWNYSQVTTKEQLLLLFVQEGTRVCQPDRDTAGRRAPRRTRRQTSVFSITGAAIKAPGTLGSRVAEKFCDPRFNPRTRKSLRPRRDWLEELALKG